MSIEMSERDESGIVRQAVAQSQRGDREALHFLYVRYVSDVLSCVRGVVPGDHQARQITQEVFGTLIARMDKYEERQGPFVGWLLDVAHDAALESANNGRSPGSRLPAGLLRRQQRVPGGQ